MARILILGGTTEARVLAGGLAGHDVTLSLAGRTISPMAQPVPIRVGGFGGAAGLATYLLHKRFGLLVDATHPYAAQISANAAEAEGRTGLPLLALRRPAWTGDGWTEVADTAAAIAALGPEPLRVFLALGRQELAPFLAAPQHHYLIRSVDPVEPRLAVPQARYLLGRGPFAEADEHGMLAAHGIQALVAKNSGGTATFGKILAARALGIRMLLLRRPALPKVEQVPDVAAALAWIAHWADRRGV